MKKVMLFIVLASLFACSKKEEQPPSDTGLTVASQRFVGSWEDADNFNWLNIPLGTGAGQPTNGKAIYHINDNGTYTIENEHPFGIPGNGTWAFDFDQNQITFTPAVLNANTLGGTFGPAHRYTWIIDNVTDTDLEVFFVKEQNVTVDGQAAEAKTFLRKFVKQ